MVPGWSCRLLRTVEWSLSIGLTACEKSFVYNGKFHDLWLHTHMFIFNPVFNLQKWKVSTRDSQCYYHWDDQPLHQYVRKLAMCVCVYSILKEILSPKLYNHFLWCCLFHSEHQRSHFISWWEVLWDLCWLSLVWRHNPASWRQIQGKIFLSLQ